MVPLYQNDGVYHSGNGARSSECEVIHCNHRFDEDGFIPRLLLANDVVTKNNKMELQGNMVVYVLCVAPLSK